MGSLWGAFFISGRLPGVRLNAGFELPYFVALILSVLLIGLFCLVLERVAVTPLRRYLAIGAIMGTIAVAIMLRNLATLLWGRDVLPVPSPFGSKYFYIGGAGVSAHELFVLLASLLAMELVYVFLKRTILGKAFMAVAHNRDAAALMGIDVDRMTSLAFILSSLLAGLGGMLVGPITFASPYLGAILGLKAFAAAIVGGLEDPLGILIGGIILGVGEQFFALWNSAAQDGVAFILILAILAFRPTGLFGRTLTEKV
jgi:branched-chain amino acid transport system permease protein